MSTNTESFFKKIDKYQEELSCHPGEYNENYIEPTLGSMQYYHCPFGWYDMPGVERGPYDEVIFPWFENTIKDIVFASYRRKRKDSEIELIEDFFYTNNFDYYLNYLKIILPTFEFVSLGIIYSFKYINKISISEFETTFILQTLEETINKHIELSSSKTIKQLQKDIDKEFENKLLDNFYNLNNPRKEATKTFNPMYLNENTYDFITWTNILNISINDLENDYKKYLQQYISLRNQNMKFLSSLPMPKFFIKECSDYKWRADASDLKIGEFKTCINCLWKKIPLKDNKVRQGLNEQIVEPLKNYTVCERCISRTSH